MRCKLIVPVVVALVAGTACVAAASPPRLQIADMARIVNVEEPDVTPNGRTAAAIVIRQRVDRYVNALVLVDVRTGRTRTVVDGRDVAVPRWSHDGKHLAYLADAGSNPQVFVRGADGTRQVTRAPGGVLDFAWSPDDRTIAFIASDTQPPADFFFAGDNDYTQTALTPPAHLWTVPARGGAARRITAGSWTVAPTDPGGIFSPQLSWSADGRTIALTRVANTFGGDDENSTVWAVDVRTRALRKLTAHAGLELTPSYAPVGNTLTYWYARAGNFNAQNSIRLLRDGADRDLAPGFDINVAGAQWFPDGRSLLVCGSIRTRTQFWRMDLHGRASAIALGSLDPVCDPYSSSTFDAGIAGSIARDGSIVFVATDATHARELYVLAAGARAARRITAFNAFLDHKALGTMRELAWTGPNGFAEDGVVTYPPQCPGGPPCPAGAKYPIVLLIHGGPGLSSAQDFVWEDWPLAQMIASRGYVVFQPNYRGSDNLGNAYQIAIYKDSVVGPSADVLAGLSALERWPNVDASRVAVSGWSYGGLLTSWLIAKYHFWRAAVSGAAVNDEFNEYDTSDSNVQDVYALGTSPYTGDGARVYAEQSPITYASAITTPTLVWGTTLDPVVPVPQSYAMYHALRDNHVPVKFAVFVAPTHGPSTPRQTAELTRLWLDWLATYLALVHQSGG